MEYKPFLRMLMALASGTGHTEEPTFTQSLKSLFLSFDRDVTCKTLNNSWLVHVGFTSLTCLSLRGCSWLQPQGLSMLRSLPSLRALDLSEQYDAVTDEAGPILAALPALEALNLALTNVGDLLIDALTYSRRLDAWAREPGVDFPHY